MTKKNNSILSALVAIGIVAFMLFILITSFASCGGISGGIKGNNIQPVSQQQAEDELASYDSYKITSHDTDIKNLIDTFTFQGTNIYNYMTAETTGTIVYKYDSDMEVWNRSKELDAKLSYKENWHISGEWEYSSFQDFGSFGTISVEFKLNINGFDNGVLDGSYDYLYKDPGYSDDTVDQDSGKITMQEHYLYIGNLAADNYDKMYDYYLEKKHYDYENFDTPSLCFIIDRNEGVLIYDGWTQWNPLDPLTKVS